MARTPLGEVLSRCFYFCGIQVQRFRIDVGKNRFGPSAQNGTGGGKKTERRSNDRVARTNACGCQSQPKSVCAGSAAHAVCGGAQRGKFALESDYFFAQNVVLRVTDTSNGCQDLIANPGILAGKVQHGDVGCGLVSCALHNGTKLVNEIQLIKF